MANQARQQFKTEELLKNRREELGKCLRLQRTRPKASNLNPMILVQSKPMVTHNGKIRRDWWLEDWEKQAILDFHDKHPLEGYRRLTFMMLDDDIVAVSPSSTYRVLKTAGRLDRKIVTPSKKGTGYIQPTKIHQEWHVDVSYINVGGNELRQNKLHSFD